MKEKKNDILAGIVIIILAAVYYVCSFQIQETTSDILGSRFFPQLAAVLLVVLAVIQIIQAVGTKSAGSAKEKDISTGNQKLNLPLILTTVLLFAYYFLVLQIGFTITSIIYLLFASWILMPEDDRKERKILLMVICVSIIFPIFLNFIFYQIFSIQLPVGAVFQ